MKFKISFLLIVLLILLFSTGMAIASENITQNTDNAQLQAQPLEIDEDTAIGDSDMNVLESEGFQSDGTMSDVEGNSDDNSSSADVSVKVKSDSPSVAFGENVRLTVFVKNQIGTAHDTKVHVDIPNDLKIIMANAEVGSFNFNTKIWNVGDLEQSDEKSLVIVTHAIKSGLVEVKANATTSSNDEYPDNNTDSSFILVKPPSSGSDNGDDVSDVSISVDAYGTKYSPRAGDKLTFVVTVSNKGGIASDTRVYVSLGVNLKLRSFSAQKGRYDVKNNIWYVGNLSDGEVYKLYLYLVFTGSGKSISRFYAISSSAEKDFSNNGGEFFVDQPSYVVSKPEDHDYNSRHPNRYSASAYSEFRTVTKVSDNRVAEAKTVGKSLQDNPTANPILIVLVSLFGLCSLCFKYNFRRNR